MQLSKSVSPKVVAHLNVTVTIETIVAGAFHRRDLRVSDCDSPRE